MTEVLVRREDRDRIAVLTLDSPANRNALSRQLVSELGAHLADVATDASLHGVLLTSSHPVFCAGADLKEAGTTDMVEGARAIVALQRAIVASPVPVVVRLAGPVRAGGLGLVASADVVVCADDVRFALTEVKLALAAAVISIPLRAKLTARAAADWFLTGRVFSAAEAREGGLVTTVVPQSGLADAVDAVLDELRSAHRQGLTEAKKLLTADLLDDFDEHGEDMAQVSGRLFHSEAAREAMAAFLAR